MTTPREAPQRLSGVEEDEGPGHGGWGGGDAERTTRPKRLALVFAAGVTAIGDVTASHGLADQADAKLGSDATTVARVVDDWNDKHRHVSVR